MNWKMLLSAIAHAAIGGAAVGLAGYNPSLPITAHTVLLPILASAATSVMSLFTQSPAKS